MIKQIVHRIWADVKSYWMAILIFLLWNIFSRGVFHAFCPFLIITGFPCAGCGLTRAAYYILTGRFVRGMRLHPAAPLWIAWIAWFLWNRYVYGRYRKNMMFWLGIVCVATLLIYIYRMINCFPGAPPMVYFRNNLLRRIGNHMR